ncbi:MAG: hypothetical protein M3P30_16425 [Chloroflexota bacterium]|nr:hypothetical protein [Chloroflexota bacterium]
MPIENRELAAGTRLVARYKKQDRTCEVVETPDGVRYRLDDGTEHRSPSSAGKAVMDGVACNGWRFWSVEGTEKPKREPKVKADKPKKERAAKEPAKTKAALKKVKSAKKPKAHRAATKSDASYGCGVCSETFPTMKKATAHAMTHTS